MAPGGEFRAALKEVVAEVQSRFCVIFAIECFRAVTPAPLHRIIVYINHAHTRTHTHTYVIHLRNL